MANIVSKYFLGEMTPAGFKTNFDEQICSEDFYTYILKGGPGTGKSSLMKKIALNFSDIDDLDLYYSSDNSNALDAIVLKKAKTVIVDGTSPHTFDTSYPGILQSIINFEEYWDEKELIKNKKEIKQISDEYSTWQNRCKKYLSALASLNSDIFTIAKSSLIYQKLDGFISRFAKKYLPRTALGNGQLHFKKLSALTLDGYTTMPTEAYRNIYILNDPLFAGSDYFLQELCEIAVSRGYSVIASQCSLFTENIFEHIMIPELQLAVISTNFINNIEMENINKINFLRFYEKEKLSSKKKRLDFSKKASIELRTEAVFSLKNAKKSYDTLKEYYKNAMDFNKINEIKDNLISKISARYQ